MHGTKSTFQRENFTQFLLWEDGCFAAQIPFHCCQLNRICHPACLFSSLNNPSSHPLLVISVFSPIIPCPLAGYPLVNPCPLILGAQHGICHSDVSHWPRVEGQDHLPPPCCQPRAWCSLGGSEFLRPRGCTAGSCSTSCPPGPPRPFLPRCFPASWPGTWVF